MSKTRFVVAVVLIAILASGAGWFASSRLRSPEQVAADAGPPAKTQLTAEVAKGRLTSTINFQATVDLGSPFQFTATLEGVITDLFVRRGSTVKAGDALLEVNDRPVIALPGRVPLWRDLTPGVNGPDVDRFRKALALAGHPTSDPEGQYGPGTAAAVTDLFASVGSAPAREGDRQVVRVGEIAMIPALPARVATVGSTVGSSETGTLGLTSQDPLLIAQVNPLDAHKLARGQHAACRFSTGGRTFRAKVSTVSKPVLSDESGYLSEIVLRPETVLPLDAAGDEVQATVVSRSAEPSLIVPASALISDSGGETFVVAKGAQGERHLAVRVLDEANGRVAVEAAKHILKPGDLVLVGEGSAR